MHLQSSVCMNEEVVCYDNCWRSARVADLLVRLSESSAVSDVSLHFLSSRSYFMEFRFGLFLCTSYHQRALIRLNLVYCLDETWRHDSVEVNIGCDTWKTGICHPRLMSLGALWSAPDWASRGKLVQAHGPTCGFL